MPPSESSTLTHSNAWRLGALETLPLIVAAIPFAILYGALAAHYQLSFWVALGMSVFVFAGASQFIAVTLIGVGTPLIVIVLTVFVVNLRHMLYSIRMMPHVNGMPMWQRLLMGFWMTDESFAVTSARLLQKVDDTVLQRYFWGSAIPMYLNWVLFTWVGIELGQAVPDLTQWGLDVAMVLAFTAIIIPSIAHRAHVYCVLVAAISAVLTYHWPYKTGLLFSSLLAIIVGVLAEWYASRSEGKKGSVMDSTSKYEPASEPDVND